MASAGEAAWKKLSAWVLNNKGAACPCRKQVESLGDGMILEQPPPSGLKAPLCTVRILPPNPRSYPHRRSTHLQEDRSLTGSLILVSLVQGLFLNLLPVGFQFPVSSFGLRESDKGSAEHRPLYPPTSRCGWGSKKEIKPHPSVGPRGELLA